MDPLLILVLGIAIVIGLIVVLRVNAFLALIAAALAVSLLAPLPAPAKPGEVVLMGEKMLRVLAAFGKMAGNIGVLIAAAAIIGECMMLSGAADRIVRFFLNLLGEERGDVALGASGFVLGIPVFFDTVFYLLSPLARSMYRGTGRNFLLYVMAIAAGGACTHTLVPPTPGPLATAAALGVGIDTMLFIGALCGIPAAIVGMLYARWLNSKMPIEMRPFVGERAEELPVAEAQLPGLAAAFAPILLPVLMISADTIAQANAKDPALNGWDDVANWTSFIGNPTFALLVATVIAFAVYKVNRRPTGAQSAKAVENALMSGGLIILITAAGGAFGEMLKVANVGPRIEEVFKPAGGQSLSGFVLMFLAFGMASIFKIAQGSSTVAMITTAGMISALINPDALAFHPVYFATSIAAGSLVISWMNDSGFWIYTKMSGLTEAEGLKSWTVLLAILGVTAFAMSLLLAKVMPMV